MSRLGDPLSKFQNGLHNQSPIGSQTVETAAIPAPRSKCTLLPRSVGWTSRSAMNGIQRGAWPVTPTTRFQRPRPFSALLLSLFIQCLPCYELPSGRLTKGAPGCQDTTNPSTRTEAKCQHSPSAQGPGSRLFPRPSPEMPTALAHPSNTAFQDHLLQRTRQSHAWTSDPQRNGD